MGTPVVTKPTATIIAPPKPSIQTAVAATQALRTPFPNTLKKGNCGTVSDQQWFRACIYSEYKAFKTTTTARFAKPENAFIVLTRSPEQLKPLEGSDYDYAYCQDVAALRYALTFPEKVARAGWETNPERTLIIDDLTEAVSMLRDDARGDNEDSGFKRMRSYDAAGSELRELLAATRRKPQHLLVVCLAKVRESQITGEERVGPDLPPSMLNMVMTDIDHVFYIKPDTKQLLTERHVFVLEDVDATGKKITVRREIFASHKVPIGVAGKLLQKYEPLDLRAIWEKIKAGKPNTPSKS